jgi:Na+-transporting NADH:ubiquinone oxidoreductase subunit NqrB
MMSINTKTGIGMFCMALLIGTTLWTIGASAYWQVLMFLFGSCGLLLILFDNMPEEVK